VVCKVLVEERRVEVVNRALARRVAEDTTVGRNEQYQRTV
jgi:hypothetical protein